MTAPLFVTGSFATTTDMFLEKRSFSGLDVPDGRLREANGVGTWDVGDPKAANVTVSLSLETIAPVVAWGRSVRSQFIVAVKLSSFVTSRRVGMRTTAPSSAGAISVAGPSSTTVAVTVFVSTFT